MLTIFDGAGQPSRDQKAEQERLTKAAAEGRPSFVSQITGRGAYMEAFKKQREKINKEYAVKVRQYHKDWRKRQVELVKDLARSQKKIEVNRYHLEKREKAGDPRIDYYKKLSSKRYGRLEENSWEDFGKSKRTARKDLSKQRRAEHRQVAQSLREQSKSSAFDSLRDSTALNHDPRALGGGAAKATPRYLSPREQFMANRKAA